MSDISPTMDEEAGLADLIARSGPSADDCGWDETSRHREESDEPAGVTRADFRSYMPSHRYIFTPTGEFWPAGSVNSQIAPIPLLDSRGDVPAHGSIKTSPWSK